MEALLLGGLLGVLLFHRISNGAYYKPEVREVHGVVSGHFDRVPPCEFRSEAFLRGLGTSSESFIRGDRSVEEDLQLTGAAPSG